MILLSRTQGSAFDKYHCIKISLYQPNFIQNCIFLKLYQRIFRWYKKYCFCIIAKSFDTKIFVSKNFRKIWWNKKLFVSKWCSLKDTDKKVLKFHLIIKIYYCILKKLYQWLKCINISLIQYLFCIFNNFWMRWQHNFHFILMYTNYVKTFSF